MTKHVRIFGHWSLIRHSSFVIRHWPLLVLGAFTMMLLLPYTLTGFLLTGDVRDLYLPLEQFYRDELEAGRLPLWDPDAALGFPALASAQIGFWYPPLFVLRVLPPEPALALLMLAHGVALAAGLFFYSRSLGHSRAAAVLTALAFTGSGFIVGHLVHTNILFELAWLPWALLLTDRLATQLRPRVALMLSAVLALSALPGHFHFTAIFAALCLVRFFSLLRGRVRQLQHTIWTTALAFAPILIGVVLLTAAQLFPTLELLQESSRGTAGGFDVDRANQHSFPVWQAITFAVPAFFGFPDFSEYWGKRPQIEMTAWVGALPLLLAVIGAGVRRHTQHDKTPLAGSSPHFWTVTAGLGILLALGTWSPLRLIGIEPTFGIFSAPARYLFLTELGLAILAGRGLDALIDGQATRWARRTAGGLGIVLALGVVVGFLFVNTRPDQLRAFGVSAVDRWILNAPGHVLKRQAYIDKVDILIDRVTTWGVNVRHPLIAGSLALLAGGSLLLLHRSSPSERLRRILPVTVGVLTAAELILVAWQVHPRVPWPDVRRVPPVVALLRDRPVGRLSTIRPPGDTGLLFANQTTRNRDERERLLRDLATTNVHTRYGIPGMEWPAALDLARAAEVLNRARDELGRPRDTELFDRLGVRYVAATSATPNISLSAARALAVFPSGESRAITVWERTTPRPRVELVSALPRDITGPLPPATGRATIVAETPQRLTVSVDNTLGSDAVLVVRDTFYPGWRAEIDGRPAPIVRADTLFRGIRVPAGTHTVVLRYRPWSAWGGLLVSAAAWTGVAFALRRRQPLRWPFPF